MLDCDLKSRDHSRLYIHREFHRSSHPSLSSAMERIEAKTNKKKTINRKNMNTRWYFRSPMIRTHFNIWWLNSPSKSFFRIISCFCKRVNSSLVVANFTCLLALSPRLSLLPAVRQWEVLDSLHSFCLTLLPYFSRIFNLWKPIRERQLFIYFYYYFSNFRSLTQKKKSRLPLFLIS